MKAFKQIDLRFEKRWILSYSLIMVVLTLVVLVRPVYAADRFSEAEQRNTSRYDWTGPLYENDPPEIDSIFFDAFVTQYLEYHRAHMLLFREYFGRGSYYRQKEPAERKPDESYPAK